MKAAIDAGKLGAAGPRHHRPARLARRGLLRLQSLARDVGRRGWGRAREPGAAPARPPPVADGPGRGGVRLLGQPQPPFDPRWTTPPWGVIRFRGGGLGVAHPSATPQDPGIGGRIHVHGSNGASIGARTDTGSMFISGVTDVRRAGGQRPVDHAGRGGPVEGWQAEDRAFGVAHDPLTWFHERQDRGLPRRDPGGPGAGGRRRRRPQRGRAVQRDLPLAARRHAGQAAARRGARPRRHGRYGWLRREGAAADRAGRARARRRPRAGRRRRRRGRLGPGGRDLRRRPPWRRELGRRYRRWSWATRRQGSSPTSARTVRGWSPGDAVTFDSTVYCGACPFCLDGLVNLCDRRRVLGVATGEYRRDGAFAERVVVPARVSTACPRACRWSRRRSPSRWPWPSTPSLARRRPSLGGAGGRGRGHRA